MKTTLDLPDDLLRSAKATAAIRGETLRDFVAEALEARLRSVPADRTGSGWHAVFGLAAAVDTAAVDRVVSRDLETVNPEEWR